MSKRLVWIVALMAVVLSARAQSAPEAFGVEVTAIFQTDEGPSAVLKRKILSEFKEQLSLRGIAENGRLQHKWLIDAEELVSGNESLIVLSITRMEALPEQFIEFGAENEAYYMREPMENVPSEGSAVRKAFSRDWLRQFDSIFDQVMLIVQPSELERSISGFISQAVPE